MCRVNIWKNSGDERLHHLLAEGSKRDVVWYEALESVSVEVRRPEQATLTLGDYSEAVDSGTYT